MNEADLIRMIRQLVRREMAPILMSTMTATADAQRGSMQRFQSEGAIGGLRMIQPYGLASRPPAGMTAVTVPVAGDPTHLNIMGQFDPARPAIGDTETALYGPTGQLVWCNEDGDVVVADSVTASNPRVLFKADGTTTFGAGGSPAVLGDVLVEAMDAVIGQINALIMNLSTGPIGIIGTPTPGSPVPTSPVLIDSLALITAQLTMIQSQYFDTASTNINSQQVFVARKP